MRPDPDARVADRAARLVAAGLRPDVAEAAARHPLGGPCVIGPGVVVSIFDLPAELGAALQARA